MTHTSHSAVLFSLGQLSSLRLYCNRGRCGQQDLLYKTSKLSCQQPKSIVQLDNMHAWLVPSISVLVGLPICNCTLQSIGTIRVVMRFLDPFYICIYIYAYKQKYTYIRIPSDLGCPNLPRQLLSAIRLIISTAHLRDGWQDLRPVWLESSNFCTTLTVPRAECGAISAL